MMEIAESVQGILKRLHAIDATFEFNEKGLKANYIFDKRFINDAFKFDDDGRIKEVVGGTIQKFYYQNKKKLLIGIIKTMI